MAALAASAVSYYPTQLGSSELIGGTRGTVLKRLKLVLTGQGGATNTIGAAALGFKTLIRCDNLYDATNGKVYRAVVDPVNNVVLLAAVAGDTVLDVTTTAAYINVLGTY